MVLCIVLAFDLGSKFGNKYCFSSLIKNEEYSGVCLEPHQECYKKTSILKLESLPFILFCLIFFCIMEFSQNSEEELLGCKIIKSDTF